MCQSPIVKLIRPPVRHDRHIRACRRCSGLEKETIALSDEGERLDVPRREPDEGFIGGKDELDLIAHKALQPVNLIGLIHNGADAGVASVDVGLLSVTVSGSGRKSRTLKPKGFHWRIFGSDDGSAKAN